MIREHTLGAIELLVVDGRPTVEGFCNASNADALEAWLATFDVEPIDIDLSHVTTFDSTALAILLTARRRNQFLRVVNPSPAVRAELEVTGNLEYLVDEGTVSRKPFRQPATRDHRAS